MISEKLKTLKVKIKKELERGLYSTVKNKQLSDIVILEAVCDNLYYSHAISYRMLRTDDSLRPSLLLSKNLKRLDVLLSPHITKNFNTPVKTDIEYINFIVNIEIEALDTANLFKLYKDTEKELPCPLCNNLIPTELKEGIRIWSCGKCSFVGMKER